MKAAMVPLSSATLSLNLSGTAYITGGASGLGRGAALAFADLGANVVIADINEKAAAEVAELINTTYSGRALSFEVDVSNEEQVKKSIQETVDHFGRLDYAINAAGLVVGGHTLKGIKDTPTKDYLRLQSIDACGVFLCMKYQLQAMVQQEVPARSRASRGVILNMGSKASVEGVAKFGSYCAAKHAVLGLTRAAALEHALDKIRVICVCPGLIQTPGHVAAAKEVDKKLLEKTPMGRYGIPDEITDGLVYACSDMGSYLTGCTLEIDGGVAAT